jgi:hypothetical protein
MSKHSGYPTRRLLVAAAVASLAVSACGSSGPQAGGGGGGASSGGSATLCKSLADFDHALKGAETQVKNAPEQASATVKGLEEQFHSFQHQLEQQAPQVAAALDRAVQKLHREVGGSHSGMDAQQAADTLSQGLTSASQAVTKVQGKIGC